MFYHLNRLSGQNKIICPWIIPKSKDRDMQNKKNQSSGKNQSAVGMMIQRCHKWRMKRKQYLDQARQATDEIARERLLQAAEHYGRIVNEEQSKIDSTRDPREKARAAEVAATMESSENSENGENSDEEEPTFPMFLTKLD